MEGERGDGVIDEGMRVWDEGTYGDKLAVNKFTHAAYIGKMDGSRPPCPHLGELHLHVGVADLHREIPNARKPEVHSYIQLRKTIHQPYILNPINKLGRNM